MLGTIIIGSIILVCVVFWLAQRKEAEEENIRAHEQRKREYENFVVSENMRVINESIDLVNNSKNASTRIGRIELVIQKLHELCDEFPHREDLKKALNASIEHRKMVHTEAVKESVEKHMDRSRLAKTITGKVNNANKALEVLKEAATNEHVKQLTVEETVNFIMTYINKEELKDIETKAERFEFKGNYKKAIDAYKDALFYLKKDDVDDALQQDDINRIETKIEELEGKISRAALKSKTK